MGSVEALIVDNLECYEDEELRVVKYNLDQGI